MSDDDHERALDEGYAALARELARERWRKRAERRRSRYDWLNYVTGARLVIDVTDDGGTWPHVVVIPPGEPGNDSATHWYVARLDDYRLWLEQRDRFGSGVNPWQFRYVAVTSRASAYEAAAEPRGLQDLPERRE